MGGNICPSRTVEKSEREREREREGGREREDALPRAPRHRPQEEPAATQVLAAAGLSLAAAVPAALTAEAQQQADSELLPL